MCVEYFVFDVIYWYVYVGGNEDFGVVGIFIEFLNVGRW